MRPVKIITPTIWVLSLVSMFTDIASEMLYPIMPIYLKEIGFSIILIGILEGIAEAVAGLSKGYFGNLSDIYNKRTIFVRWGYGLSAISKPLLILFTHPAWVFFNRTMDRFGKGIRTGARDAMLSNESSIENKAKVFGFHRSFDTLGAAIGPLIALIYLYFYPKNYIPLFLIAFLPGIISILLSFKLSDKNNTMLTVKNKVHFFDFIKYWKTSSIEYRKLVIGLLIFALVNSSDMFLLLRLKENGFSDTFTIGMYVFFNLIYAVSSYPLGVLADKIGMKPVFLIGLSLFAIVYLSINFVESQFGYIILFMVYGFFGAATEGVSKAWISTLSKKETTATAIGTFTAFQSICAMLASSFTGLIWYSFNSKTAFISTSFVTILVIFYLTLIKFKSK